MKLKLLNYLFIKEMWKKKINWPDLIYKLIGEKHCICTTRYNKVVVVAVSHDCRLTLIFMG